jgi:A/G-specific adenine glycosylase
VNDFLSLIYSWYANNKRDLPWRRTQDPYKIWISEIILQQTRVAQGVSYYLKFIRRFPNVHELAVAAEDEILKIWQGLGYYSRARNLHDAAKFIVKNHDGKFPDTYNEIINLKGIGPYTAAAISSIAFNLPFPALDGNVTRVLARLFGIVAPPDSPDGKKKFQNVARDIMPAINPGFHNQALMEFGALQCVPKSPRCFDCPVAAACYANIHRNIAQLPAKAKKISQRTRFFCYFLVENENYTWIEKRTLNDIWKNLYQLPLSETESNNIFDNLTDIQFPFSENSDLTVKFISPVIKHILSHQVIFARIAYLQAGADFELKSPYLKIPRDSIQQYPVPRLLEKLINTVKKNQIKQQN